MKFLDFKFKPELQKAIDRAGFKEPSPIQQEAIPVVLDRYDMVGQAHTGTGKTAAFGLPILNMLDTSSTDVQAVIIVPTRELAVQVSDEIYRFGRFLGINTATVYGGQSYTRQIKHINNSSVVVATPGRFLDLLRNNQIDINPNFIVLDEADEMLDMGFLDDIKEIFDFMPTDRQTLLFSATMPKEIKSLINTILDEPKFVTIESAQVTNTSIKQVFYVVDEHERDDALIRLLDYKNPNKAIIFCRMKKEVDRLSTFLVSQGYITKGLHGDMEQRQREEVIKSFKSGRLEILIATDVAARGLDVNDVTHVFNYHLPFDNESYVHRIGRTGRAGKNGTAVSIVTPEEFRTLQKIQKHIGVELEGKVVPNINSVKEKKVETLLQKIKEAKINKSATDIIEQLSGEMAIDDIALLLASYISNDTYVKGNNYIGKSQKDIKYLIERSLQKDPKKNRGGYRGRGRRNNSNHRGRRNNNRNRG
jgi:ATP-dependent RNA helicase DeaD